MRNTYKYYCIFFLIICFSTTTQAQYLCDNEAKVINKQKKFIKKKAESLVKDWYTVNAAKLRLPVVLKFSKIKFLPEEDLRWEEIDSLLCIKENKELVVKAKRRLGKMKLAVYDIRAYFNFENTKNKAIRSILYFKFDINGNLIVAVIREKEDSPYSEKYYH